MTERSSVPVFASRVGMSSLLSWSFHGDTNRGTNASTSGVVVKADSQSEIQHYFTYISDSFSWRQKQWLQWSRQSSWFVVSARNMQREIWQSFSYLATVRGRHRRCETFACDACERAHTSNSGHEDCERNSKRHRYAYMVDCLTTCPKFLIQTCLIQFVIK